MAENVSEIIVSPRKARIDWLAVLMTSIVAVGILYFAIARLLPNYWQTATGVQSAIIYDLSISGSSNTLTSVYEAIPYLGLLLTLALVTSVLLRRSRTHIEGCSILFSLLACPLFSCMIYSNLVTNLQLDSDPSARHLSNISLDQVEYRLAYVPERNARPYHVVLYECDSVGFICFEVFMSPALEQESHRVNAWTLAVADEPNSIAIFSGDNVYSTYVQPALSSNLQSGIQ